MNKEERLDILYNAIDRLYVKASEIEATIKRESAPVIDFSYPFTLIVSNSSVLLKQNINYKPDDGHFYFDFKEYGMGLDDGEMTLYFHSQSDLFAFINQHHPNILLCDLKCEIEKMSGQLALRQHLLGVLYKE